MKRSLLIVIVLISVSIASFGQSWSVLPVMFPYSIRSVDFSDNDHGYITCTNEKIFKTGDGGVIWTDVSPNFTPGPSNVFTAICTLDSLTAFAGSDFDKIIRTYDGGLTWDSVNIPIWQVMEIKFINDTIGFAQGMAGFFRTVDRGITWAQLATTVRLSGLYFITENLALSGGSANKIYKTTDQGVTWTLYNTQMLEGAQGIYFFNANHGIAVDGDGYWSITHDQGVTWNLSSHFSHLNQVGIHFINNSLGFKIYSNVPGSFFTSTDGGITWTYTSSSGCGGLSDMDFPSDCVGYISSLSGHILKFTDPGCSTLAINLPADKEVFSIYPNPVKNQLNLSSELEIEAEFFLYDISSRQLIKQLFSGSTQINMENLARGMYLYEIRSKNQVIKKGKVVKE